MCRYSPLFDCKLWVWGSDECNTVPKGKLFQSTCLGFGGDLESFDWEAPISTSQSPPPAPRHCPITRSPMLRNTSDSCNPLLVLGSTWMDWRILAWILNRFSHPCSSKPFLFKRRSKNERYPRPLPRFSPNLTQGHPISPKNRLSVTNPPCPVPGYPFASQTGVPDTRAFCVARVDVSQVGVGLPCLGFQMAGCPHGQMSRSKDPTPSGPSVENKSRSAIRPNGHRTVEDRFRLSFGS